jgi:4-hydroxybenzoate polyprenyltransferase
LSLSLVIYALGYKNWLYIAIIVYFLLVLYSKYLKPIAFLGNILIAFLASALPVVMYNFIVKFNNNNLESIFFPLIATYSIFTFLIMLVREINLDIEDLEGDKQFGCKTLPILLGFKKTKTIIFSICVIHIIFSIFASCYFKNYYFTYLLIDCILIYYLFRLFRSTLKNEIIYCRNILRYTLLIGLIGFATEFSIKNSTQHGIGKIGAKVLNLSNGILLNSSAEMNICTSNSPTSPIPKR